MDKWLKSYTLFARETMTRKTADNVEKVVAHFLAAATEDGKRNLELISVKWVRKYLREIVNHSGVEGCQLALRVMKKAWKWGERNIDRFPRCPSPFGKVKELPIEQPIKRPKKSALSIEEIESVVAQVKGQKAVMLLVLLQLGLREKDLFSPDISRGSCNDGRGRF